MRCFRCGFVRRRGVQSSGGPYRVREQVRAAYLLSACRRKNGLFVDMTSVVAGTLHQDIRFLVGLHQHTELFERGHVNGIHRVIFGHWMMSSVSI